MPVILCGCVFCWGEGDVPESLRRIEKFLNTQIEFHELDLLDKPGLEKIFKMVKMNTDCLYFLDSLINLLISKHMNITYFLSALCVSALLLCSDALCRTKSCGWISRTAFKILQSQSHRNHQSAGGKTSVIAWIVLMHWSFFWSVHMNLILEMQV